MNIKQVKEVTPELINAFGRLMGQLSQTAAPPTEEQLKEIVASGATRLLVAEVDGKMVGSLALALFRIPTGVRAWIEDVVVDEAYRGQGIGEALNREALELAKACGARTVDLTSRPSREAANRLYQRLGFELRKTNLYRISLE